MERGPLELVLLRRLTSGWKTQDVRVILLPLSIRRYEHQQMLEEIELMAWSLTQVGKF